MATCHVFKSEKKPKNWFEENFVESFFSIQSFAVVIRKSDELEKRQLSTVRWFLKCN